MTKKELEEMKAWGEENSYLKAENKKLKEDLAECDDLREELDYRKRVVKTLKKDKEIYEKVRSAMFWPEEEDLYEDIK